MYTDFNKLAKMKKPEESKDAEERDKSVDEVPKITVKPAPSLAGKIAVWDRDPAHPDGEIVISGDSPPQEVAHTRKISEALSQGILIAVEADTKRTGDDTKRTE